MIYRVLSLLVFACACATLTSCSAPPPLKDPEERRRPDPGKTTLDALIVDREEKTVWIYDLRLRGAADFFQNDDWTFFEVEVPDQKETTIIAFKDLKTVVIGEVKGRKLPVTLIPRNGPSVTGTLPRRAYLEGSTDFGPLSMHLREVRQISFGGRREASDRELEQREDRKRP